MADAEPNDVIIIGGGPGGLFAACELARAGVRARIIDSASEPHHQARGTAIQPAMLEMLSRAGVVDDFLAAGVIVRSLRICAPGLNVLARTGQSGIDCRYEFQCSLPQWRTEEILADHLARLGGGGVERGLTVSSIDDDGDHLAIRLTGGEVLRTRYVIGAGGAHSVTRRSMKQTLEGETYAGHFIAAEAALTVGHEPNEATFVVAPQGFVLMAPLPDDRWLLFVDVDDEAAQAPPTFEHIAQLVKERVGRDVHLRDLVWASNFRMHKRIVRALSDGRRFLVGDAAHQSSPIGGEGLNSALMDAGDLAWKMALVLQGRARPVLLESYANERHLADQHVLEVSDLQHRLLEALIAGSVGGATPSLPAVDAETDLGIRRSRAMLDVSYAGSPIVADRGDASVTPAPGSRYPDRTSLSGSRHHLLLFGAAPELSDFRARWDGLVDIVDGGAAGLDAARAGVAGAGAVLLRPDGYIGFRVAGLDEAALQAVDAHLDSYLIPSPALKALPAS